MAIDTLKKKYTAHQHQVKLCNDLFNGVDYAKQHLLQYSEEKAEDYKTRKDSANLDNFVFRTIDTMKNIVFRKDIDISGVTNSKMLTYLEKIDLSNNIDYFAKQVFENARKDGHTFILADSQAYDKEELTTQQMIDEAGIRPYLVNYKREDVINWQGNDINFADWVVIKECEVVDGENFTEDEKITYRVLYIDGTVRLYNVDKDKNVTYTEFMTTPKTYPILVKVGKSDIPEFYDMAKINVNHLNRNSELDNYVRIGGAPFLVVGGTMDNKGISTIAINQGMKFDDDEFKVEWVEMSGANSEIIRNRIKDYEIAMMKQSVEFLTADSNLTATQVNKESTPKESKLKSQAREVEDGINLAIEKMGMLVVGGLGENIIIVNKDFDNTLITAEEAESYRQDYIQGIISLERLWMIYERGERLAPMTDQEKEAEKVKLKDQGDLIS